MIYQLLNREDDIYWIRLDANERITAALCEKYFTKEELTDELEDFRRIPGEVHRVLTSRVVIGEALKPTVSMAVDTVGS